MWSYEKKLQYPVNIKNPNPKLAQMIISQYGGAYTKSYTSSRKKISTELLARLNTTFATSVRRSMFFSSEVRSRGCEASEVCQGIHSAASGSAASAAPIRAAAFSP